ncbi:antibiotic biosynthesis monooxygenase family protein [Aldersonia kunmingensis]|uniref:antibiotic biosynthesis monooxygenase family protein n=1 Tax=Aldersonia kunmingensis TaxID=408066 RepID=UPI00082B8985|nr:antibiotic biosynthesis monooxygenase [Aldersonia kunmingensis]
MRPDSDSHIVTVFRSRLRPDAEANGYFATAKVILERAQAMPGFLSYKVFTADDGERVSIVEFDSTEHHNAWRDDPEHREAQQRGRRDFYTEYSISVTRRYHHRSFRAD